MDLRAKKEWVSNAMPVVTVPHAIGAELASAVRDRLEKTGYTRYGLVDRASYDFVERPHEPELLDILGSLAQEITGRTLEISGWRALRLLPGDYILVRHDRVYEGSPIELTLDLSAAAVPAAEIHYRHRGQVFATVPSQPGNLTITERSPTVMCNHTYVTKLYPSASIVRLVVMLTSSSENAPTP